VNNLTTSTHRLIAGKLRRWNDGRAEEAYRRGWWVSGTLAEALTKAAVETPERVVIVEGERQITCSSLGRQATAIARALMSRAAPGATVSFMLPNWYEAAVVYLGASIAGMVVHPILPSLRESELLYMLRDVDSRVVFIPETFREHDYLAMLETVVAQMERPPELIVLRGNARSHTPYEDLLSERHTLSLPEVDADAVQMVLYTSGTTGTPKGVMHSHNSMHALVRQLGENWLIEPGDRFLVPSPVSHIGGSIYAFEFPLLLGTTAVLMDQWNAEVGVDLIAGHGCTHMAGATPFLEQLMSAAKQKNSCLRSLKLFVCGGAAVPPALIKAAALQFDGAVITRVYGSTEVPVTTVGALDRADIIHAAQTDGRVAFAKIKLVAHDAARTGEGEIFARGPQMLVGFVHTEDEVGVFDDEGFYRTGDIGYWVDADYLVVSGRAKDIIIRKGENISPKEVEDILLEHPDVGEVAIVGIPHATTGEQACAIIVRRNERTLSLEEISAFLAAKGIAAFKRPERLEVWDTLPKNATGKILKNEIRASLLTSRNRL